MLVSRLMNPLLSITFGIAVRRYEMVGRGIRNELIGLLICFAIGAVTGASLGHIDLDWESAFTL